MGDFAVVQLVYLVLNADDEGCDKLRTYALRRGLRKTLTSWQIKSERKRK
jgi:hypothetical protein